jgi:hypothetical protein
MATDRAAPLVALRARLGRMQGRRRRVERCRWPRLSIPPCPAVRGCQEARRMRWPPPTMAVDRPSALLRCCRPGLRRAGAADHLLDRTGAVHLASRRCTLWAAAGEPGGCHRLRGGQPLGRGRGVNSLAGVVRGQEARLPFASAGSTAIANGWWSASSGAASGRTMPSGCFSGRFFGHVT